MTKDLVPNVLKVWANPQEGMTLSERLACLNRLNIVNNALERCFRGEITFMDWLDIADENDVDVEDFLNTFEHNLGTYLGIDLESITPDYFYLSN